MTETPSALHPADKRRRTFIKLIRAISSSSLRTKSVFVSLIMSQLGGPDLMRLAPDLRKGPRGILFKFSLSLVWSPHDDDDIKDIWASYLANLWHAWRYRPPTPLNICSYEKSNARLREHALAISRNFYSDFLRNQSLLDVGKCPF